MEIFPGFVGPSYTVRARNVDVERTMNWYVENAEAQSAKAPNALLPTPGLDVFAVLPQGPGRGILTQNGRTFAVGGGALVELSGLGATTLGAVTADARPATLSTNGPAGHQVFGTSGTSGFLYDLNSGVFTASVVTGADMGAFVDGYFLALDASTSTLKISNLEDGATWPGGDVAQRNTAGDRWRSLLVAHRDVWLFGSQRTDVWRNTGNKDFPFEPIDGAFIEQGIAAAFSAAVLDNAPTWLGENENGPAVVWQADGYAAKRISTHAVELAIQGYAQIDDAVAWTYESEGHSFYVLNFQAARATWVYDASTQSWHERGYWDVEQASFDAYRAQFHAFAFGKHLVMDRSTSTVYALNLDTSTDVDGAALRRVRRTPYLENKGLRATHHSLQVDFEVGLGLSGLSTTLGADPQAMLRWSDDQGKTWSHEHLASVGPIGKYGTRVKWNRLGQARNRVYELSFSDPVPARLAGAWIDVTGDAT